VSVVRLGKEPTGDASSPRSGYGLVVDKNARLLSMHVRCSATVEALRAGRVVLGSRIIAVDGTPVADKTELLAALQRGTNAADATTAFTFEPLAQQGAEVFSVRQGEEEDKLQQVGLSLCINTASIMAITLS
jgi:hypothetical protein